jgi:hypothetical protein
MTVPVLSLSSGGMKNVGRDVLQEDFVFVVGPTRFTCSWVVANFLSPMVHRMRFIDPSINSYVVETKASYDQFQLWLSLGQGSSVAVDKCDPLAMVSLSRELGNSELCHSLLNHFQDDGLSSRSVFPISDPSFIDFSSEQSITDISSHFHELDSNLLDLISFSTFYQLLSQNSLRIASEDSLYGYISTRIASDPEYFDLLRFIRFEYLSPACLSHFTSIISADHRIIDRSLWNALCGCWITASFIHTPQTFVELCFLPEGNPLNGIISQIAREHVGNIHDLGIVTLTSKSQVDNPTYAIRNLVSLSDDWYFGSANEPGQWVCWDFHEMRVIPTSYTISGGFLKSWVIEGSIDGINWTLIDQRADNMTLFGLGSTASFTVRASPECRFVRLTQTAESNSGLDSLDFAGLEIFGTLKVVQGPVQI